MKTVIKNIDGTDYKEKQYKQIGNTPVVVEEKVMTVGDIVSNISVQGMKDPKKGLEIYQACIKAQTKGIDGLDVKEKALILETVNEVYRSPLIQGRMDERFNLEDKANGVQKEKK